MKLVRVKLSYRIDYFFDAQFACGCPVFLRRLEFYIR
ncbi:MAG: hypothetical protein QOD67_3352 [Caballeronia sp.]|nr:hypothetical protein [Caballeronia sp.]